MSERYTVGSPAARRCSHDAAPRPPVHCFRSGERGHLYVRSCTRTYAAGADGITAIRQPLRRRYTAPAHQWVDGQRRAVWGRFFAFCSSESKAGVAVYCARRFCSASMVSLLV